MARRDDTPHLRGPDPHAPDLPVGGPDLLVGGTGTRLGGPDLREPELPRTAKVAARTLRTGWTTGTCAAAAAKAAATALLSGLPVVRVEIGLPRSARRVSFPVARCELGDGWAEAVMVKDAGDDPDVTNGAQLTARLSLRAEPGLRLEGGEGVGTVTRPGLGLQVGGPAINPVPRRQIAAAVGEVIDLAARGVLVVSGWPARPRTRDWGSSGASRSSAPPGSCARSPRRPGAPASSRRST